MTPRDVEIARYARLYASPRGAAYRPTTKRMIGYRLLLEERPDLRPHGLLDVGAGHGFMLSTAENAGYRPALGTEVAPSLLTDRIVYGAAWDLPFEDRAFGTVTSFDVLEHLLPDDVPAALAEIARVADRRILLLACCLKSVFTDERGHLHPTVWPPARWEAEARAALGPRWILTRRLDANTEPTAVTLEAVSPPI